MIPCLSSSATTNRAPVSHHADARSSDAPCSPQRGSVRDILRAGDDRPTSYFARIDNCFNRSISLISSPCLAMVVRANSLTSACSACFCASSDIRNANR